MIRWNSTVWSVLGIGALALMFVFAEDAFDQLQPWHLTAALSLGMLVAWVMCYRRYRTLTDTPFTAISTAPQGYIGISGIGRALPGTPLLSPFNYLPCLWYHVLVEIRTSDNEWRCERDETSEESFLLVDDNGSPCVIDPRNARVDTALKDILREPDRRTTQRLLVAGTRIHALGHFRSSNPAVDRPALNIEVREKLADWKDSGEAQRFDLDENGELSMQEWDLARAAARREAEQERVAAASLPDRHQLTEPPDGRPFIISDRDPAKLARNYRWQAWGSLALFFATVAGTTWLKTQGN